MTITIAPSVARSAPRPRAEGGAESLSALINLAGRQRMLSQRIVLHAVLSAQGDAAALGVAQEALELFRSSHARLLHSRQQQPAEVSARLQQLFFGEGGADAPIREFIRLVEDTLNAAASVQAGAKRLMASLVARATPMLALLNEVTQAYELLAREQALAQRQRQSALMQHIRSIASEARIVSLNARVIAARAGDTGREFAVVAGVLSGISEQIEQLTQAAMTGA